MLSSSSFVVKFLPSSSDFRPILIGLLRTIPVQAETLFGGYILIDVFRFFVEI